MIFDSSSLKFIFDLIIVTQFPKVEIRTDDENIYISANYNDDYYITYYTSLNSKLSTNIRHETPSGIIVLSQYAVKKVYQLVTLWPRSTIEILENTDGIYINTIFNGQLIREKPVIIESIFEKVDYYLIPPYEEDYNCSINSKNLKQMLEFCNENGTIINIVNDGSLKISDNNCMLVTIVNLEEVKIPCQAIMKLNVQTTQMILMFLDKILARSNLVYFLYLEYRNAFSIKAKIDDISGIRIYTIHN